MPKEGDIRVALPRVTLRNDKPRRFTGHKMRKGMKREYAPSYEKRRHIIWNDKLWPTALFCKMLRNHLLCVSQSELATILEVTQATVSSWENSHKVPQRRMWLMLKRLAEEHEQRQRDHAERERLRREGRR